MTTPTQNAIDRPFLRKTLWATGLVTALVALVAWRAGFTIWASRYAVFGAFAWVNWCLLAVIIDRLLQRRLVSALALAALKMVGFAVMAFLYLPAVRAEATSALAALNTFFVVLAIRYAGRHLDSRGYFEPAALAGRATPATPSATPTPAAGRHTLTNA